MNRINYDVEYINEAFPIRFFATQGGESVGFGFQHNSQWYVARRGENAVPAGPTIERAKATFKKLISA